MIEFLRVYRSTVKSIAKVREAQLAAVRKELEDWKQAASVEAGLRREFQAKIDRISNQLDNAKEALLTDELSPDK